MPKKDEEMQDVKQEEKPAPVVAENKPVKKVYYTNELWKGFKPVVKCANCGQFRDTVDEMILHVILHVPAKEQEELFNKLVQEKQQ